MIGLAYGYALIGLLMFAETWHFAGHDSLAVRDATTAEKLVASLVAAVLWPVVVLVIVCRILIRGRSCR